MTWSKPYDRIDDGEYFWRQFEKAQIRRERFRLIKKGLITPDVYCPPTMMVRNNQPDERYIFGNGKGWSIKMEVIDGK